MTTPAGISGFGTTLVGATSGAIIYVRSLGLENQSVDVIDVSSSSSTDRKREKVPGMIDGGEISFEGVYEKDNFDAVQDALGDPEEIWTLTLPDTSAQVIDGFVTANSAAIPYDDVITQSFTITVSGLGVFTPAV